MSRPTYPEEDRHLKNLKIIIGHLCLEKEENYGGGTTLKTDKTDIGAGLLRKSLCPMK